MGCRRDQLAHGPRHGRPTVTPSGLVHVGTLEKADAGTFSFEGDGLSVSQHPHDWVAIAALGDAPWHLVERADGAPISLLDVHALTDAHRDPITGWAAGVGLVELATVWVITWWDDEMDCELETVHTSEADALDEAGDPSAAITTREMWLATPTFTARGRRVEPACWLNP